MFNKGLRKSLTYSILFVIGLITLAALSIIPNTKFDYDFENFFPTDDPDLRFYKEHVATFESDNDFLLVGVANDGSIYEEEFLNDLDSLTRELEKLDHVIKVISPTNINNPVIGPFGVAKAAYIHADKPEFYQTDSTRVAETPGLIGSFFSEDQKKVSLFVKLEPSKDQKVNAKITEDVEGVANSFGFHEVHVAGKIKGAYYFIKKMKFELVLFMSISFLLLIVFLFISFRSFWGIWVPLSIVGITLIWMIAFMTLINRPINFMTTLLPTILFVVCISNVVHIVEKYLDEIRKGRSKLESMATAFKEIGLATFFTAFTTAVGFLSLYTSMIIPIKEFGWITAIGVYAAFFLSFSLLPALLYLLKKPKVKGDHADDSFWSLKLHRLFQWLIPNRQLVFALVLGGMLLAIGGLYMLEVDNKFLEDYSSSEEMSEDYMFFENNFSGFRPFELAIWLPDTTRSFMELEVIQEVDKIERGLKIVYGAGFLVSPNTFVKGSKRAMNGGKNEFFTLPEDEKEMKRVSRNIKRLPRVNLRNYLNDEQTKARINGKVKDFGGKKMRELDDQFAAYMEENIDPGIVKYRLTGMPHLVDKTNEFLARNIVLSLSLAFLIIAIIMGLLFQSFRMIIIAVLPNLLPLLVIAGLMGLTGINIKISTSIIFAIAFGIAVDDTIHFMSKLRIEMNKGKHILYALKRTYLSTGKAIIVTSLILCSGFLILIVSGISSTFYIGLLVSSTLFFAVLSDLFFLPVLVIMFYNNPKKQKRKLFGKKKRELMAS